MIKHKVIIGVVSASILCAACEAQTGTNRVEKSDNISVDTLAEKMVSEVEITELSVQELPTKVAELISGSSPDFTIGEIQKKVRDGRTYYDVEGETPEGAEVEFDILMTESGPEIVEVQRDLVWEDVPEIARIAAEEIGSVSPVRVIESKQPDNSIIYELFADGKPEDPSMEVRVADGKATVLTERWPH